MHSGPATIKLSPTVHPLFSRPPLCYFSIPPSRPSHSLPPLLFTSLRRRVPPSFARRLFNNPQPWWTLPGPPTYAAQHCTALALPQVTCNSTCPLRALQINPPILALGRCQYSPTRAVNPLATCLPAPGLVCPNRSWSRRINTQPTPRPGLNPPTYSEDAICHSSHICQLLVKADTAHYTYLPITPL